MSPSHIAAHYTPRSKAMPVDFRAAHFAGAWTIPARCKRSFVSMFSSPAAAVLSAGGEVAFIAVPATLSCPAPAAVHIADAELGATLTVSTARLPSAFQFAHAGLYQHCELS